MSAYMVLDKHLHNSEFVALNRRSVSETNESIAFQRLEAEHVDAARQQRREHVNI